MVIAISGKPGTGKSKMLSKIKDVFTSKYPEMKFLYFSPKNKEAVLKASNVPPNRLIFLDDAKPYLDLDSRGKYANIFLSWIARQRHDKLILIFVVHNPNYLPVWLVEYINSYYIFKNDTIIFNENKFENAEELNNAQKAVNLIPASKDELIYIKVKGNPISL